MDVTTSSRLCEWRKCAVHCWHITSSPHQWTKSCSALIDMLTLKSQRKIIPVVFTLHMCAHVHSFFFSFFLNGGEIFWSWFWIPQRWWMFLLISIVIVKSIRKGWYTEKKIHQIFLHRVWMLFLFYFLSCIAVYLPAWRIWTHSTSFTRAFFALNFVGVKAIVIFWCLSGRISSCCKAFSVVSKPSASQAHASWGFYQFQRMGMFRKCKSDISKGFLC